MVPTIWCCACWRCFGKLSVDRQTVRGSRRRGDRVAMIDKGEQRFDQVIAVAPPRADVEREVDLRPATFLHVGHHGAVVAALSPSRSFASIRAAMSASANSAAARHV